MQTNVRRYTNELLYLAAFRQPWEVSEEEFVSIVAMLVDGTVLLDEGQVDIHEFLTVACKAADLVDPSVTDVAAVYRACRQAAKEQGLVL
jgi:hypothetical protein